MRHDHRPERVVVQLVQRPLGGQKPPLVHIGHDAAFQELQRLGDIADVRMSYPDRTLRAFHTAMKVNESTQMAVLAGISGTGKSQLPRQ